jgi:hypothetical protein
MAELLSRDYLISRDDLRTRSEASGFRMGVRGRKAESVARTAQMIALPEGQTRSLCRGFFWAGTVSTRRSRIRRDTGNLGYRSSIDRKGTPWRDAVIASWRNEARSRVLGRRRRETARDDCISERGSKVFEVLEGGNRDSGRPEGESSMSLRRAARIAWVLLDWHCLIAAFGAIDGDVRSCRGRRGCLDSLPRR